MSAKEIYSAQKTWEGSGANESEDKAISDANHNRSYNPQGESARVSDKLNSDCQKQRNRQPQD